MQEIYTCPQCGRKLQAPVGLTGHEVQCAVCGTTFVAQRAEPVPRSYAPERPSTRYADDYRDTGGYVGRRELAPHRGNVILTLGAISLLGLMLFVVPGLVIGLIALMMGNGDLSAMRNGRMDRAGESATTTGRTLGLVAILLGGLLLLTCGFFGVIGAMHDDPFFSDF